MKLHLWFMVVGMVTLCVIGKTASASSATSYSDGQCSVNAVTLQVQSNACEPISFGGGPTLGSIFVSCTNSNSTSSWTYQSYLSADCSGRPLATGNGAGTACTPTAIPSAGPLIPAVPDGSVIVDCGPGTANLGMVAATACPFLSVILGLVTFVSILVLAN